MMEWDASFGQVFIGPMVVVLCICWSLMWLLWHFDANFLRAKDSSEEGSSCGQKNLKRQSTHNFEVPRQVGEESAKNRSHTPWVQKTKTTLPSTEEEPVKSRSHPLFIEKSKSSNTKNLMGFDQSLGLKFAAASISKSPSMKSHSEKGGHVVHEKSVSSDIWGKACTFAGFGSMETCFSVRGTIEDSLAVVDPLGFDCNKRRLKRRRLYCLVATLCGFALLISVFIAADPAEELLMSFSSAHQAIFAMAIGHWTNALWEDLRCRHFLVLAMSRYFWESSAAGLALQLVLYFMQSCLALFTFCFILATHSLGGLGIQCLLFEAPAALLTHRELALSRVPMPDWLNEELTLRKVWRLTGWAFAVARGPAFLLWLCSLIPGIGAELPERSLGASERAVYYVLTALYVLLNLVQIGLMLNWFRQDFQRAEDMAAQLSIPKLEENTFRNSAAERQSIWDSSQENADRSSDSRNFAFGDRLSHPSSRGQGSTEVRFAATQEERLLPANKSALRGTSVTNSTGTGTTSTESALRKAKAHFEEDSPHVGLSSEISSAWAKDANKADLEEI